MKNLQEKPLSSYQIEGLIVGGGACHNIARMPGKNEIRSAMIAHLAHHAGQSGITAGPVETDLADGPIGCRVRTPPESDRILPLSAEISVACENTEEIHDLL